MTEPEASEKTLQKQVLSLVRHLLRHKCSLSGNGAGEVLLSGQTPRHFAACVIDRACSMGLAMITGDRICATREATTFLRRALIEGESRFCEQHGDIVSVCVEIDGDRQPVRRNLAESPLGMIARLKDRSGKPFLPQDALDAGERLAADFTRGQLQPRITSSWEPKLSQKNKGAGGKADINDSAMEARARFSRAVEAIGPELSGVAMDICCFSKGLETVERERQWPSRSAKLMLRTALLALARHYAPPPPQPRRSSHHWGMEDFKPGRSNGV